MRGIVIVLMIVSLYSCTQRQEYIVQRVTDGAIQVDGEIDEEAWRNATKINSFINPWNKDVSPPVTFAMLRDARFVYFYFDAKDNDIVLKDDFNSERDVEVEDRVELFFSKDPDMKEYYGLEMDPQEKIFSYRATYYRQFDYNWEPPDGMKTAARIYPGGYIVEGMIPIDFLQRLSDGGAVLAGIYRGEFSKEGSTIIENWMTWVDPKTKMPDFHVPASLGKIILSDE